MNDELNIPDNLFRHPTDEEISKKISDIALGQMTTPSWASKLIADCLCNGCSRLDLSRYSSDEDHKKVYTWAIPTNNRLTTIPLDVFNIPQLTALNLSGNLIFEIPAEIGKLTTLTSLNLGGNGIVQLPKEIGLLAQLEHLDLSDNHLTSIPPAIGALKSLHTLDLSYNYLTYLPPEIKQIPHLSRIELRGNQFLGVADQAVNHAALP